MERDEAPSSASASAATSSSTAAKSSSIRTDDDRGDGGLLEEMLAACRGGDLTAVRRLLKLESSSSDTITPAATSTSTLASAQDRTTGTSPLMEAAGGGHADVCRLLLEVGAPWNALDRTGRCAGNHASDAGHQDVVDLLVDFAVRAELVLGASERAMARSLTGAAARGAEESNGTLAGGCKPQTSCSANAADDGKETDRRRRPVEHDPSTKPDYLSRNVRYRDGALLDEDDDAVMMEWERPLMDLHASVITSSGAAGKRVLNVGFGMGIVDGALQDLKPSLHVIIEAHPGVHERMLADGWGDRPGVRIMFGRWQEELPKLIEEEGMEFDGIFFDTYGEHYTDMEDFHEAMVRVLAKPDGVYSFFNGLAPDNIFFHGVACQCVKLQLAKLGLKAEFVPCEIEVKEGEWEGVRRKYWHDGNTYYLPICTWDRSKISPPENVGDEPESSEVVPEEGSSPSSEKKHRERNENSSLEGHDGPEGNKRKKREQVSSSQVERDAFGSGIVRYVPIGASSASELDLRSVARTRDAVEGGGLVDGDEDAPGWRGTKTAMTPTDRDDHDDDGAGPDSGGDFDAGGVRGPTCWKCRGLGTTTAKRRRKPGKQNRGCIPGEGRQRARGDGVDDGGDREPFSESRSDTAGGVHETDAALPTDDAGAAADQPTRQPASAALPDRPQCSVCDGRGHLPTKRSAEEASRKPGVITRPRRTHPGFVPFGPTPRAVVQLRRHRHHRQSRLSGDGHEFGEGTGGGVLDADIVEDWNVRALEFLERAETSRTEVEVSPPPPADEERPGRRQSHSDTAPSRRPSWLPGPGEQLCNLVGEFRILQRVGSHRWTTDDLVTAYVASTEARRNFSSWRSEEDYWRDGRGAEDGGRFRYLDLGCGNASVLLITAWSLVRMLGDGDGEDDGDDGSREASAPDGGDAESLASTGAPVGINVDDGRLDHGERMEMDKATGEREKIGAAMRGRRRRTLCCTGVEARGEATRLARRSIEFNLGIPSSPPRSSSALPPTSTFCEEAIRGEGGGDEGTGGGSGDRDCGLRVAVDVRAEVVHGDFRRLIANGGGEDDRCGRSDSHRGEGGVVDAPTPPTHAEAEADADACNGEGEGEGGGEDGSFDGGGRCRTMTMKQWVDRDRNERDDDGLFHLITGTPPYFRVDFTVSSAAADDEDRDGAAATATAPAERPHPSPPSGAERGERLVVHDAVIRQGGMPTSLQSAPARCEFRGGVEEYCAAASRLLHPRLGAFVVCENWANRGRVHVGAASAGLVVVRVLPVRGKVGRPHPLFAVYVMRKREYFSTPYPTTRKGGDDEDHVRNEEASIPEKPEVLPCLSVRDERGRWTEEYGRLLHSLSIPAETAASAQL